MEYKCGLIKDLMPLYHDGVCSEDSAAAVEEHLAHCEACKDAYQALLRSDGVGPNVPPNPEPPALGESLKRVKRRSTWKMVIACVLAVAVLAAGVTGAGLWLNADTIVMPEDLIANAEVETVSVYPVKEYNEEDLHEYVNGIGGVVGVEPMEQQSITIRMRDEYVEKYNLHYHGITSWMDRCDADGDGEDEWIMLVGVGISYWNHILDHLGFNRAGGNKDEPVEFTLPVRWEDEWDTYAQFKASPESRLTGQDDKQLFRLYFIPDVSSLYGFGRNDPDSQRHILEEKAILVWEQPKPILGISSTMD